MDRTVEAAALAGSRPPTDLSFLGLFLNADLIGKSVIVLLILASFWSWAIIIEKLLRLRRLPARAAEVEDMFWSGG
ncbi:MAG: Tol-Pal system subunit TolQ, partial [Alphaproteobacteria bacterium]